jgi:hypothetical protein
VENVNLQGEGDGLVDLEEDVYQAVPYVVHHVAEKGEDVCQEALLVGHEVMDNEVVAGIDRMEGVDDEAGRDVYGCLFQGMCDYGENDSHGEAAGGMENGVFRDEVSFRVASSMEVFRLRGRHDPQALSKLWRPHCVQLLVLCCIEF